MEVIDHEPHAWFLFREEDRLLFDANCNHNTVGYSYTIKLSPEEINKYKNGGHEYLNNLAYDIHYSAPVSNGSNSIYKGRDLSDKYSDKLIKAIKSWREENESA